MSSLSSWHLLSLGFERALQSLPFLRRLEPQRSRLHPVPSNKADASRFHFWYERRGHLPFNPARGCKSGFQLIPEKSAEVRCGTKGLVQVGPHGDFTVLLGAGSSIGAPARFFSRSAALARGAGFAINVASATNGANYVEWTHIDGWSEAAIYYIAEIESAEGDTFR